MRSILAYTKFELLQAVRIPMVYVALLFLPSTGMLLFVVPVLGDDPAAAVQGTAAMCLFAVLTICSAQYGIGIADSRMKPWGGYVRTLPGGPLPKIVSMLVLSMALVLVGSLPLIAIAAFATDARIPVGGLLLGLLSLGVAVVPFSLLMLTLGYAVNPYTVMVLTSILPVILAYLGGYFADPFATEGFIAAVAPFVPTRGPAELVWASSIDYSPNPVSMVMLVVWTAVFAFLAYKAYRSDEGKRFK
jgi:ABC-2 type transport system permease protein